MDPAGIPFPRVQGNGPSARDEEAKMGLFLSCGGTLGVPLECQFETNSTEVPPERRDSFPDEAGKWTLLPR